MSESISKPNFSTSGLELTDDGYNKVVQIDGREWAVKFWDTDSLRQFDPTQDRCPPAPKLLRLPTVAARAPGRFPPDPAQAVRRICRSAPLIVLGALG